MKYVGIDLGKWRDHSAIAIVEKVNGKLLVRHLERLALGTPYTRVVERVREIVGELGDCIVVVDGTGVGEPVVEALRRAGLGCEVAAVTITSGERETRAGSRSSVPKQDLMARLQLAIEKGELRVARRLEDAGALVKELLNVRAREGLGVFGRASGRVRVGADGYGEHDDLVMAVALACWRARRRENSFGEGLLPVYG
ncbi:MAG TPA: hypothetical protein VG297_18460 [Bryobacteraceae bacterium]|jgi:hypothetical protein|nr:hypothetical protein [Bryobacteraceae bacterium]